MAPLVNWVLLQVDRMLASKLLSFSSIFSMESQRRILKDSVRAWECACVIAVQSITEDASDMRREDGGLRLFQLQVFSKVVR